MRGMEQGNTNVGAKDLFLCDGKSGEGEGGGGRERGKEGRGGGK